MKVNKWIESSDKAPYLPVKLSGRGDGTQLKGFDARDRKTTKENGALVTSDFLKRNPSRIQQKREWVSPEGFLEPTQQKPIAPVEVKKWLRKGYDLVAPAVAKKTGPNVNNLWKKVTPNHSPEKLDYPKKRPQ
jgi:hypothetical protein